MLHIHDQKAAVMNYGESQYAEGRAKATLECIRNLMESTDMTTEQAVQALGIPVDERAGYIDKVMHNTDNCITGEPHGRNI